MAVEENRALGMCPEEHEGLGLLFLKPITHEQIREAYFPL